MEMQVELEEQLDLEKQSIIDIIKYYEIFKNRDQRKRKTSSVGQRWKN